ncbi:MAG: hypothetical protein PHU40_06420 [Sulfurimonas sp.]|nr:hypothetical protein [Sulfurimonas sp.]
MSEEKKMDAKKLFENYVPEIIEYDPLVDAKPPKHSSNSSKTLNAAPKILEKHTIEIPAAEFFQEYEAEILHYDPKVDGSDEYKIRDNHLNTKAALIEKVRKAKAARKDNQTTFRQNIRTENE